MTPGGSTAERWRTVVHERLDDSGRAWLDASLHAITADASAVRRLFPAVSRTVGRGPLAVGADVGDPFEVTVDDAVRALLLAAVPADALVEELAELYRHGDPRERRGALRSLDVLVAPPGGTASAAPGVGSIAGLRDSGRRIVDDALRTNDTRLVAAALGVGGVALLDDEALCQAVLKCIFVGLDTTRIPGLAARTTPQMSRMVADFVHERIAARRSVPATVWPIIDAHPPLPQLTAIEAETRHPDDARARAARSALSLRPPPPPTPPPARNP